MLERSKEGEAEAKGLNEERENVSLVRRKWSSAVDLHQIVLRRRTG